MTASSPIKQTQEKSTAEWLTSEQVCKHLCISRPTLHRYVKQHHLNPKRLPGGQLRFSQSEVDSLLT